MPQRPAWQDDYAVGSAPIDAQHRALLEACRRLADLCERGNDEAFDEAFARLKALVGEHFEAEAALLAERGCPDLEAHAEEHEEFVWLADEIASTANFDRLELQRFVSLWCVGHIASAAALRDSLADPR